MTLVKNTMPGLPRPLMTLDRVELRYKKGQIKLKVRIK